MEIIKSSLEIGLMEPVKLLHVTDSHVNDFDDRDDPERQRVAKHSIQNQDRIYGDALTHFRDMIAYANENCDAFVHSGDMISLITPLSMEHVRQALDESENSFVIAGNHEFSRYCGEAWEDIAYRMTNLQLLHSKMKVDMLFSAKQVGGVNIVGIDDGYYQVEPWQLYRLKREVAKGLPIVLVMHVPLYEQSLYTKQMEVTNGYCAYVMGCDEEHLLPFNEYRAVQQRPSKDTLDFIDYVNNEPLIRCVLAGHIHLAFESRINSHLMQYVTDGGYKNICRELTLY